MTYTYDPMTNIGKMRLMIPDRDQTNAFFTDEELNTILSIEGANPKRATAQALETMASDQAMVLKVIRLLDLSTDGRAVSQELRARAADLRKQADSDEIADDAGFDIAEWGVSEFAERQIVINEALRDDN